MKELIVLGCSSSKVQTSGTLPAISLYDGPWFRVLRTFLRDYSWPDQLSVAVVSAKYGFVGAISPLSTYDERMTSQRAAQLNAEVTGKLRRLAATHRPAELVMGVDYLPSIDMESLPGEWRPRPVAGQIGQKQSHLRTRLRALGATPRHAGAELPQQDRPLYFLPDWDDFLDTGYDFQTDCFSQERRAQRTEEHSIALMRPQKLCDGVLVSLAQNLGTCGLLRRVGMGDDRSLAPRSVRKHFKLQDDQWAFGDCGAFSYAAQDEPSISVEQAVALYDLYDFDLGASVDHIPVAAVPSPNGNRALSDQERLERVVLTRQNAQAFLDVHRRCNARFIPVGVIQGVDSQDYANQVGPYVEMGYTHIALGGLVPRSDADVQLVVEEVVQAMPAARPWLHLLGVFRPNLQGRFRQLGVNSFDSATYFRKAWLRSGQNYLAPDGSWYAAIRVPPSRDPRTMKRLRDSGMAEETLLELEAQALQALRGYDRGEVGIDLCLQAVQAYDNLLPRADEGTNHLLEAYRATLENRPWLTCGCPMCRELGIEMLIFRGFNRNKRRGAHNTLQLFERVQER